MPPPSGRLGSAGAAVDGRADGEGAGGADEAVRTGECSGAVLGRAEMAAATFEPGETSGDLTDEDDAEVEPPRMTDDASGGALERDGGPHGDFAGDEVSEGLRLSSRKPPPPPLSSSSEESRSKAFTLPWLSIVLKKDEPRLKRLPSMLMSS